MSRILRNFATLRGLDQEEYLLEARNSTSLGPSLNSRERWPLAKSNEGLTAAADVSTATVAPSTDLDDIPADESDAAQDCLLHPKTMANLTLLNQEYRKAIAHLERDLLMAKNELNFELFLKQQHIQQISKVHRAHVLDASVEAEQQNLYNTCRSLKDQLQETKLLLEKEKNELERRKNKQLHWDAELKTKLQTFRDERKQLQFELERLQQDIDDTRQAQEIQERLLTEERKGYVRHLILSSGYTIIFLQRLTRTMIYTCVELSNSRIVSKTCRLNSRGWRNTRSESRRWLGSLWRGKRNKASFMRRSVNWKLWLGAGRIRSYS